jgi:hypothetical protein
MIEIEKYGGYDTGGKFNHPDHLLREGTTPFKFNEVNPYVEAFWKWWPDLYRDLHTFRITGGEPLLSKDTWGVLDYIINQKEPNRELHLAINSNLGAPDDVIDKFIEKVKRITEEDRVKEFVIFTSCDAWGEQAEYIRNGLVFNKFWDNVNKVLSKCPKVTLTFMVTYNALSVFSFNKLLRGVYDLKNEYGSKDRYWDSAVFLDTSYLRYPYHQSVQILPHQYTPLVLEQAINAEFMGTLEFSKDYIGYTDIEVQKIKRTYDWMKSEQNPETQMAYRKDFHIFFSEHDRRRGTNFLKVFPELEEFYNFCGTIK